jgi:hypothetical protein
MPLTKLQFRPGFVKDTTTYANEGGWQDGNKVRFRMGFPEKIGGWQKVTSSSYLGVCRALLPWFDLDGTQYTGVGTSVKYYVLNGGIFYDVTPIRETTSAGDVTFSATDGSSTITVSDTAHGAQIGDFVTFSGAVSLGGVITADVLNQEYEIASVVDANSYTIVARAAGQSIRSLTDDNDVVFTPLAANSSDTGNGGASAVGAYQISTVSDNTSVGTGWSAGSWSRGTWNSSASTGISTSQIQTWSHDTFGEDILINRRGGPVYVWDTSTGSGSRAVDISTLSGTDIPTKANQVLVSDRDRHVIAFGVNDVGSSDLDPMLIRFSDQEDYTNWEITATTSAGSLRLGNGSEIVGAIETRQQTLVFTDTSLYAMQYLGPPFTFGVNMISRNTSIVSPKAGVAVDDAVFWMGDRTFYVFTGAVQEIPCPVLDYVFDTMRVDESYKTFCGSNVEFGEVWWFYPCIITGECNRYVVYNYKQQIWYTGTIQRQAWVDRAGGDVPMAADTGYLYYHETGLNDASTDPSSAIEAYVESSPLTLGEGDQFMFLSRLIPDVTFEGSTVSSPRILLTVSASDAPGDAYGQSNERYASRTATSPVEQFTEQVYMRLRGRQMKLRVDSDETGTQWRLGIPRADLRTDGRR